MDGGVCPGPAGNGIGPERARGLDKPVLHPHPFKILFLTFTIQNVPAMGKFVAMF